MTVEITPPPRAAVALGHTLASPTYDHEDEIKLEQLGYKQELRRGMGLLGSIGLCTGIIQPLLSAGVVSIGFSQGGPVTVIWGFLIFFFASLGLLLCMSEVASKYITAGGPYNWVGRSMVGDWPFTIGGVKLNAGSFPSYMNAWLVMLSFFGSMASVNSAAAQALYSMDLMRTFGADPSDPFKPRELDLWDPVTLFSHQGKYGSWKKLFGITVGITVSQFIINMLPLRYMNKAAWVSFGIMVSGCLMIIIGLPAIALKHQTWTWVWTQWYSNCNPEDPTTWTGDKSSCNGNPMGGYAHNGLKSYGWMFCAGLLQSQFLVNCYDQPSHMAEETHNASWTVPRSMIGSYVCAGFLNFCLLLSYMFSIQNPAAFTWGVTQGMYGTGSIFWDVFASRFPDTAYADGSAMPNLDTSMMAGYNMTTDTSYDTSADNGGCLLKSGAACLNMVTGAPNPTVHARNGAMFFTFVVFCGAYICGLMNTCAGARFLYSWARDNGLPFSAFFRRVMGFNGVPVNAMLVFTSISICFLCSNLSSNPLEGYISVSAISSNGYLLAFGVPCLLRLTTARNTFEASPDFNLGRLSKPAAALGICVSLFSIATIALPEVLPANKDNLNYSGVALGAVIVAAIIFWPVASAVWGFVGPSSGIGHDADSLKAGVAGLEIKADEGEKKDQAAAPAEAV